MVRNVLLIVTLIIISISLFGCQTVQGFGRDVTWTGEKTADLLEQ